MRAEIHRLSMAHPGDVSALASLLQSRAVHARSICAIIGKTEGNGGVNDFTRGYFTDRLMTLLERYLNEPATMLAKRIPCVLSGGTEGVLSPHYTVLCRVDADGPGSIPALAIGTAFSEPTEHALIGTKAHAQSIAAAVRAAVADAGIEAMDDVHFVQVKTPCLTSARLAALQATGVPLKASSAGQSMARARAAGAMGVAVGLGEMNLDAINDDMMLGDFAAYCSRASISSGVEVDCNEVVVLGNSRRWTGPLTVAHRPMQDAIDLDAIHDVLGDLGLPPSRQVGALHRDRIRCVLVKAEPDRRGAIRGQRHTMLNDIDIDPQRHIRGAVGGLVAGVIGDTRIFVSGGAEHQGPDGGGLIAVIAERAAQQELTGE
ncbi:Cyanuric acid amidohydrolase [Devosia equisanguinis]|uniref:Cyclic amide hydrolase n=1 Tax=Devosia equisanguinis TaxID=2490941 RepID=A0A3S4CAP2_9HYPH|nr:ring-opening amidohydrolase [Devosia equisanguinis]VDS02905.1 Cyanuric acid amidohydrolase [Devosia equisanguinis]